MTPKIHDLTRQGLNASHIATSKTLLLSPLDNPDVEEVEDASAAPFFPNNNDDNAYVESEQVEEVEVESIYEE